MDVVQTPNSNQSRMKRNSVDISNLKQENMNYIDTSEVIVNYYKNQRVSGLDKYFLQIEEWLKDDTSDNIPLVIEADEGVGKKTLLVKWMEYHEQNNPSKYSDYIIAHFATTGGNNSNYFFAIYRILIKLREALNITQKVELLEEKLRRYFAYWLELSNKELDQQIVKDAKVIYDKVIIIFEGIDHFRDQQDLYKEANVAFWLPRIFPKRIKVIITADGRSAAMNHFKGLNCKIMNIVSDNNVVYNIIESHMSRETFLSEKRRVDIKNFFLQINENARKQPLFVRTFLSIFIPYPTKGIIESNEVDAMEVERLLDKVDFEVIKNLQNIEELIHYILDYFSKALFSQEKFERLLTIFTITQKGLTIMEIREVCDITQEEWKRFLTFFKMFLMFHRHLWIINNDIFKAVVVKKYHQSYNQILELHEKIADVINKKTQNSIRKLEEHTFHLFMSKSYFKLKEVISIIENFLLLFNPNNKYDLCRYWQKLEEHGFDPVLEYNKAVEGFQIHYHPSAEDIFRIIIQISRFLKEFGDFETFNTPEFRHPPIMGLEKELEDVGLLREILVLNLYFNQDPELKSFKRMEGNQLNPAEKLDMKMENLKSKQSKFKPGGLGKRKKDVSDDSYTAKRVFEEERRKVVKTTVLSELEQLNVEIPQNRDQVRSHYMNKMLIKKDDDEYQQQKDVNTEPEESKEENTSEFNEKKIRDQMKLKIDQATQQIEASLTVEPEETVERVSSDYYYKRWIWIQFPWACISLKCDYSAIIKQCFSSATNYMSVEEEHAYTNRIIQKLYIQSPLEALKIAIEAKLKKAKMYERNPDEQSKTLMLMPPKKNQINDSLLSQFHSVPSLPNISIIQPNNNTMVSQGSMLQVYKKPNVKNDKAFFITQDYLGMNLLNKELQSAKDDKELQLAKDIKDGLVLPDKDGNPQGGSLERCTQSFNYLQAQDGEMTMKMLDRSKTLKARLQGYQAGRFSLNNYGVTEVFPTLKQQMNKHTSKELTILEQQAKIMRRELDSLIYQNLQLAKDLKFQKVLEFNKGYLKKEMASFEDVKDDLKKLEKQVYDTEEEYRYSSLSKERVKTILKICRDNKQQNEDWIRHLTFLINNFKKLIKFEEYDIVKSKEQIAQIKKIIDEYLLTYKDKVKYQANLLTQIRTSISKKKTLDSMFKESDSVIEESAMKSIQQLKQNQKGQDLREKQQKRQNQLERNAKVITEKLDAYLQDYVQLQPCFDIKDPNYSQTAEFHNFLQSIEKKTELRGTLIQQQQKFAQLEKIKEQKENLLKTYQSAIVQEQIECREEESNEPEVAVEESQGENQELESELESKYRQLKHFLQIKLDCQLALNSLNEKLIPNITNAPSSFNYNTLKICEQLKVKKDKIVENMGDYTYKSICDGTFDLNQVYKSIMVYQPDPLLTNKEIE